MSSTPMFHRLIDAMTTDIDGLLRIYQNIRLEDEFVNSFCEIVENVYLKGKKSLTDSLRVYVTRNDFLVHQEATSGSGVENAPTAAADSEIALSLKQVEINLSSVVGPHTMQELSLLHRDLVIPEYRSKLPTNTPRDGLIENLCMIDDIYKARVGDGQRQCILWVVALFESNFAEILACVNHLKSELEARSPKHATDSNMRSPDACATAGSSSRHITLDSGSAFTPKTAESGEPTRVFIVAWDELAGKLSSLKFENQRFYFNPAEFIYNEESYPYEVSIVYFRTGYRPDHYQTQNHWKLREYMEECQCAVVPSAVSQLVGLKKAQQVWSSPEFLDSFEKGSMTALRDFFVDQVDLNETDPHTTAVVERARSQPHEYVLKPQREGGGNNLYGDDIPKALDVLMSKQGRNSHVLMEKIKSPETLTEVFVSDTMSVQNCISEIGFYGVTCFNGCHEVINEPIGYLLRTKNADSDEGGICVNAAVFDSVMLV